MSVTVTAQDVARVREAVLEVARVTPVLSSWTLAELAGGGDIVLKAENLQRTGSFKVRGTTAKLAALGDGAREGVVAGSAGNHAWALALAARQAGVACEVVMPPSAPLGKVEGCRALGATVTVGGVTVDDCVVQAREIATRNGMAFVHPFDDPDIVAGQGTIGLELLEQVPELAQIVVPIGGGGLAAGVALAVKAARPEVRIVGVQAAAVAAFLPSLAAGHPVSVEPATTIADGIALKRPGKITLPIVAELVDETVAVGEDDIAQAMTFLLERAKLVVEGGGAVGLAALMAGIVTPAAQGTTCVILSGGNVDVGLLATVARRHETQLGRRLALFTRIADQPGALAALLALVASTGANLVEVGHVREGIDLHIRETAVQIVLETRGADHAEEVLATLREAGHVTRVVV